MAAASIVLDSVSDLDTEEKMYEVQTQLGARQHVSPDTLQVLEVRGTVARSPERGASLCDCFEHSSCTALMLRAELMRCC
jgi:hypothetical protein